jgi:GT2 family glycosyltransferase
MEDQREQNSAPAKARSAVRARVIVVNYNGGHHLGRCVQALLDQTIADFEVVIADNGSTDDSLGSLADLDDRFQILELGENLGFAAANNRAADAASAPWLVTLNPDAFPDPDWLETLLAAADRFPDIAMFGSTQISDADPNRFDGTGDGYFFTGFPWRGNHGRAVTALPAFAETFSPCAAAAMWRRQVYEAAGGFDERFFCYCEDVDLAFRLRLGGERCVQVAAARVRHVGSASTGDRSPFSLYHGARNRIWTMVKNMPAPLLILAIPAHIAGIILNLLKAMGRPGGLVELKMCVQGLVAALMHLAPVCADRRRLRPTSWTALRVITRTVTWSPLPLLSRAADLRPVRRR